MQSTWVEIDLDAFVGNLQRIRELVGAQAKLHVVVKADAYGHGAVPIARVAQELGCHSLGVATLDEGIELRRAGIRLPILILSPSLPFEADRIVFHRLSATVSCRELALALSERALATQETADVHIEVDTGMGRSGIDPREAVSFVRFVKSLGGIRLAGMFTHFPEASPDAKSAVHRQLEEFRVAVAACRAEALDPGIVHAANSAGIVNHPASHLDLVRPGLLAYGVANSDVEAPRGIRPVMRFVTRLVHLRDMPAHHGVSYNSDFVTPGPMRVGTGAVGYGHGYPWSLSSRGGAVLRGVRIPILGRVTMDTTVFDVGAVPDAALGDPITLFGDANREEPPVTEVAELAGTIPYEILVGIGRRVPRIYIRGGHAVGERSLLESSIELNS